MNSFFVTLRNRGLVKVKGAERADFLQGLITNDVNKLAEIGALYACLLTPQGKFLHDFFVIACGDEIWLECEGGSRAQDLHRRLMMYRLRKDVEIEVETEQPVYAVFGEEQSYKDTRHADMGWRSFDKPDLPERGFETWDSLRISLCIPYGSRDLVVEKSTMDEGNMDALNAIDYKKGCYVGQELTARMHYRGLGKRRLQTVALDDLPEGAELRSTCGDMGIALVRVK